MKNLIGSEKQISWASAIRSNKLTQIQNFISAIEKKIGKTYSKYVPVVVTKEHVNCLQTVTNLLCAEEDAKFWIERRDYKGVDLLGVYCYSKQVQEIVSNKTLTADCHQFCY